MAKEKPTAYESGPLSREQIYELELSSRAPVEFLQIRPAVIAELVRGYLTLDLGEVKNGDAFMGGMLGAFAGSFLERKLASLSVPPLSEKGASKKAAQAPAKTAARPAGRKGQLSDTRRKG